MIDYIVVIPARYHSTRLPGKPLLRIGDKPMIQHVVENALRANAQRVVVATDHEDVYQAVKAFGGEVIMTKADHPSGSDRIAEVAEKLGVAQNTVLVNVQGDEPDMPPALIDQVALALIENPKAQMSTACAPLAADEVTDPNTVKVVRDSQQRALYFSRAPIPFDRDGNTAPALRRHLGIYAYSCAYIQAFAARPACALENTEKLEQLRALWHGEHIICVDTVEVPSVGIDTPEDLAKARAAYQPHAG